MEAGGKARSETAAADCCSTKPLDDAERARLGRAEGPPAGATVLDRLHQTMILFAAGRGEWLQAFPRRGGQRQDTRFWKLAQASACYPAGSDEKRWVDGVLARKKGLGSQRGGFGVGPRAESEERSCRSRSRMPCQACTGGRWNAWRGGAAGSVGGSEPLRLDLPDELPGSPLAEEWGHLSPGGRPADRGGESRPIRPRQGGPADQRLGHPARRRAGRPVAVRAGALSRPGDPALLAATPPGVQPPMPRLTFPLTPDGMLVPALIGLAGSAARAVQARGGSPPRSFAPGESSTPERRSRP